MRRILVPFLAAILNFGFFSVANAEMVAADPELVAKVLRDSGYKAAITKADSGDPIIASISAGTKFLVYFYYCKSHTGCSSVQFFAGYDNPKNASLEALNTWNSKHNFVRAYRSDKGQARLEMDVNLDKGGMSQDLFKDNFNVWIALMARFEEYINGS